VILPISLIVNLIAFVSALSNLGLIISSFFVCLHLEAAASVTNFARFADSTSEGCQLNERLRRAPHRSNLVCKRTELKYLIESERGGNGNENENASASDWIRTISLFSIIADMTFKT
jgi:hypothetical protein